MSVLDLIRFRQEKRDEQQSSAWDRYREIVLRPLATGQEVDVQECNRILDAVGKDESDLEGDVEQYRKRLELAERFERHRAAIGEIAEARAEHDAVQSEWLDVQRQYQPRLDAAIQRLTVAERDIDATASAKGFLLSSVMDPTIRSEQQRIANRSAAVKCKLEGLQSKIDGWQRDQFRCRKSAEHWQGQLSKARLGQDRDYERRQLKAAETGVKNLQGIIDRLEAEKQSHTAELVEIAEQLAELRERSLEP